MKHPRLSVGEETLALHLKAHNIPFLREVQFAAPRRWRFDFVVHRMLQGGDGMVFPDPHFKVAIEIDGGTVRGKSRHSFGMGYEKDCNKLNEAAIRGWRVMRFTTAMVRRGEAILTIEKALE